MLREPGLEEHGHDFEIGGRNLSSLNYADDTSLIHALINKGSEMKQNNKSQEALKKMRLKSKKDQTNTISTATKLKIDNEDIIQANSLFYRIDYQQLRNQL